MSSGGGGNTTTTSKTELPLWAQGSAQSLLNRADWLSKRPYEGYQGQQIADFNSDQLAAQNMARIHAQGSGTVLSDSAAGYTAGLLSNGNAYTPERNPYAGANPYLNQLVQDAQGDVTRAYSNAVAPNLMAQFNSSGAYGGTAHQAALGDSQRMLAGELGNISTNLRSQDYDRQVGLAEADIDRRLKANTDYRAQQLQALALAPQTQQLGFQNAINLGNVGDSRYGMSQNLLDQRYNNWLEMRDWEPNQLGLLSGALGAATGGQSNMTQMSPSNKPSPWTGALGGAATGAALGSVVPVIGTGVGALIGAGLGYFGSK